MVNGTFKKLPGGTEIVVAPQRGGGTSTPADIHPFKVIVRQFEENGPWYWGVINNSKLFNSIAPIDDGNNITGLLGQEQSEEDPNWFEITAPDYIYIERDIEGITTKIETVGNGGNFDPDANINEAGAYVEVDTEVIPNEFKFIRKIIATAEAPENEDEPPIVTQGIKQHQLYTDIVMDGYPVAWFFDYSAGRKIFP